MANPFSINLPQYQATPGTMTPAANMLALAKLIPEIEQSSARTGLMESELGRQNAFKAAMEAGDTGAAMRANPEMGMQLAHAKSFEADAQVKKTTAEIEQAIKITHMALPGLNVNQYPQFRSMMQEKFPGLQVEKYMPDPRALPDEQSYEKWKGTFLYQTEMVKSGLAAQKENIRQDRMDDRAAMREEGAWGRTKYSVDNRPVPGEKGEKKQNWVDPNDPTKSFYGYDQDKPEGYVLGGRGKVGPQKPQKQSESEMLVRFQEGIRSGSIPKGTPYMTWRSGEISQGGAAPAQPTYSQEEIDAELKRRGLLK